MANNFSVHQNCIMASNLDATSTSSALQVGRTYSYTTWYNRIVGLVDNNSLDTSVEAQGTGCVKIEGNSARHTADMISTYGVTPLGAGDNITHHSSGYFPNVDTGFPYKTGETNRDITQTIWIRPGIVDRHFVVGKIGCWEVWIIASHVVLKLYNAAGTATSYTHASHVTVNKWYFIGVTYDTWDSSYRIHVWDKTAGTTLGTNKTGTGISNPRITSSSGGGGLGGGLGVYGLGDWPTDGLYSYIDEFAIFNIALSQTDIDTIRAGTMNSTYNLYVQMADSIVSDDLVLRDLPNIGEEFDSGLKYPRMAECTDTGLFTNNGGTALMFTNGYDKVWNYEGHTGSKFVYNDSTFSGFGYCRELVEFYNYFMTIMYFIPGDDVVYGKSIEHSGAGDYNDHSTVSSGNYNLFDGRGKINGVVKLGNILVIFLTKSVIIGAYYGSATKFTFKPLTTDIGLIAHNAYCVNGNDIYFISNKFKFYKLSNSSGLQEIGQKVQKEFFSNISNLTDLNVFYNQTDNRVYFVKKALDTGKSISYVYNLNTEQALWEYFEFDDLITYGHQAVLGPDTAISGYYYPLLIDGDCNTYVFKNSYDYFDTTNIACEYQTEDISVDQELSFFRSQEFVFTAKSSVSGAAVVVQYSIDNGVTWINVDESPIYLLNNIWKTFIVHFDVVSRVIRFRFTQSSKDLQIKNDLFINYLDEGIKEITNE